MIIAFGSKARQGKDTAGEAVVEHFNNYRNWALDEGIINPKSDPRAFPSAKLFKFADALYRIAREEYGMTEKDAPLLQKIGNGSREQFGADYWINQIADEVLAYKGIAVITDMRYRNEGEWVKANGGSTVNVRRFNQNGERYYAEDRDPNHISETSLDEFNFDYTITAKTGEVALVSEYAITLAEYIRGLEKK